MAYRQHGLERLSVKNQTYSGDFKLSVIKYMYSTGSSARQAAVHFNIKSHVSVCKTIKIIRRIKWRLRQD